MIRPQPFWLICPSCHYCERFAPSSDVLLRLPPQKCPKCGTRLCKSEFPILNPFQILGDIFKGIFSGKK